MRNRQPNPAPVPAQDIQPLLGEIPEEQRPVVSSNFLNKFGKFCAGLLAIACGASTAAIFMALNIIPAGLILYTTAALICGSGIAVNWFIFGKVIPDILNQLLLRHGLSEYDDRTPLSFENKLAMGIGFVLSLSAGVTFAALSYSSTFTTFGFLAAVPGLLPTLAVSLVVANIIGMTALLLNDIADLIKNRNKIEDAITFLKNLTSIDPNLPHNRDKSPQRVLAERITATFLTFISIPLAFVGLYMTMKACIPAVKSLLTKFIPSASEATINFATKVITLGTGLIAQVAFIAKTAAKEVAQVFKNDANQPQDAEPRSNKYSTLYKAVDINAVGNACIALKGTGHPIAATISIIAGLTALANSRFAGRRFVKEQETAERAAAVINVANDRELNQYANNMHGFHQQRLGQPEEPMAEVQFDPDLNERLAPGGG